MTVQRHVSQTQRQPQPIAIDLFSGCGGLSLGLKQAGFHVQAAIEIDSKAQETYKLNHTDVLLYGQDIRTIDPVNVMQELNLKPGDLDLLAGCPPCQGFSRLRTRNQRASAGDPRNKLVKDFFRFAKAMLPKCIMMENVPALINDTRFKRSCEELKILGYTCSVNILDAADYRVPQRRRRLILLASRVHTPAIAEKAISKVTVRQALLGIGSPETSSDPLHAMTEQRSIPVRKLIALIPKNGGSRSDLPPELVLQCHKNNNGFNDVYGRMRWDDVAPTITSGCNNPSKGRFLHPHANRAITLREAAILQGFPHTYQFIPAHGKEAIALMIGNALPPPFIAAHARALRTSILGR